MKSRFQWTAALTLSALAIFALAIPEGHSHCDTLDGPVVMEARTALDQGELTPVLKWLRPDDEAEVRAAFELARAVRGESEAARRLADTYFFETLVRVHRAGEGAPYSGLKPAGAVDPAVALADKALETGDAGALVDELSAALEQGIHSRLETVRERRAHMSESVEAGRRYVEAYVDYVHYAEGLHQVIARASGGHAAAEAAGSPQQHPH